VQKLGELEDRNAPSRGRSGHRGELQLDELSRQQLAAGHRSQQAAGNLCSALHRNLAMGETDGEKCGTGLRTVRSFVPKVPFQNMDSTGTFAAVAPSQSLEATNSKAQLVARNIRIASAGDLQLEAYVPGTLVYGDAGRMP